MHGSGCTHTGGRPELTPAAAAVRSVSYSVPHRCRRHARPIATAASGPPLRRTGQPASRWAEPLLQCSASPAAPATHADQHRADASVAASTAGDATSSRTPAGDSSPLQQQLTSATAAAQATTAHAAAMQAALDAQSITRSSVNDAQQQQQPPLRDAFSRRDGWERTPAATPKGQAASGATMPGRSIAAEDSAARSAKLPLDGSQATDRGEADLDGEAGRRSALSAARSSSGTGGGSNPGSGDIGSPGHELVDLLGGAEDDRMGHRARSASDANV